jgi:hypothetical protein
MTAAMTAAMAEQSKLVGQTSFFSLHKNGQRVMKN